MEMPEPLVGLLPTMAASGDGTCGLRVAFMVQNRADLRKVSTSAPLHTIIQDLIEAHNLGGSPDDFALVYKMENKIQDYRIVTEQNRAEMNANIIELGESPAFASSRIITEISKVDPDTSELTKALVDLRKMCVDPSFARVFFHKHGLELLMQGVATSRFRVQELGIVLDAITLLVDSVVDQDLLKEQSIQPDFVKQLSSLTTKEGEPAYSLALQSSLSLLSTLVKESEESRSIVDREVALPNLISLLASTDPRIQLASISLINSLLKHASMDRRADMVKSLQERPARTLILEHLLTNASSGKWEAMAHQLYLLQHHMLAQVDSRLFTKIEPQDSAALNKIKELRSTAFDTGSPNIKNNTRYAQDHKKLGFDNIKDPSLDFLITPPGVLALDCMDYFAKSRQEQFMKVVLENSCSDNHECPFAASSIELVRQLAVILAIGQPVQPNCKVFHEMFFKSEHPFEEFFCYCVVLLNKTWRDMRATKEDFNKVFDVVVEQIRGSLNPEESTERPKTFEQFRTNIKSYVAISKKWQTDARNREAWEKSAPVAELRKHLEPEIKDLIREQRCNFMVEGTRFQRYKKTGEQFKSQYRYVKLHTNHKTIYVGDWNSDKSLPTIEDLEPRLQIADIELLTEGDCPFLKHYKKEYNQVVKSAFSLVGEDTSLDLVAPDQQTFNYWTDGIKCLKRQPMASEDFQKEMKVLLDMEVKLRLLDLEGVELPKAAPVIPPPPADFNFSSG